jgi:RNA polymerase sigma-70 factor, ECF subfamily
MDRYAAGDDDAFAVVYDALAPRLYAYLLRHTRNAADAADLLQQTMLHIHRGRGVFISGAEVAPWAFAIARRLLSRTRRRGLVLRADEDLLDGRPSETPRADDLVHAHELAARVDHALAELPSSQRQAFELTKKQGLSLVQAAQVLGTTVCAVKLRIHRAYTAIRATLAEAGTVCGPASEDGRPQPEDVDSCNRRRFEPL